eukprot:scaffold370043_cov37-Prasinocladus_malaysianus.AAC.2
MAGSMWTRAVALVALLATIIPVSAMYDSSDSVEELNGEPDPSSAQSMLAYLHGHGLEPSRKRPSTWFSTCSVLVQVRNGIIRHDYASASYHCPRLRNMYISIAHPSATGIRSADIYSMFAVTKNERSKPSQVSEESEVNAITWQR